jgi:hypothetical protein
MPKATSRTVKEPARETKVCYEADVVVVGGGPGGHSAAIAAARNGAKTVLLERYGHLGGMATGGIEGGTLRPRNQDIGSSAPKLIKKWSRFMGNIVNGKIKHTAWVDPELLKCVLNDMAEDAKIKLYLHSWGTQAIVADGKVKGVIFESKSGRQAVLGKIIIDGTGDGDLLPSAGAEFDAFLDPKSRSSMLALVFRLGNCDYQKLCDFRETQPEKFQKLIKDLTDAAGTHLLPLPSPRNDVLWVNNWIPNLNCMNVEDLTTLEVEMRKMMRKGHAFLKKHFPTFENSFILDTASQTGTRGGRRLVGEYIITKEDFAASKKFADTIAVFPRMGPPGGKEDIKHVYIPYRALVPAKVEGLLVAGRSFSSDYFTNNMANLIPHCIAMGQAAGTGAALAVKQGISARKVDYKKLQKALLDQGVPLPGIAVTKSKK